MAQFVTDPVGKQTELVSYDAYRFALYAKGTLAAAIPVTDSMEALLQLRFNLTSKQEQLVRSEHDWPQVPAPMKTSHAPQGTNDLIAATWRHNFSSGIVPPSVGFGLLLVFTSFGKSACAADAPPVGDGNTVIISTGHRDDGVSAIVRCD